MAITVHDIEDTDALDKLLVELWESFLSARKLGLTEMADDLKRWHITLLQELHSRYPRMYRNPQEVTSVYDSLPTPPKE